MQDKGRLSALLLVMDGLNHDLMETDYHTGPTISRHVLVAIEGLSWEVAERGVCVER